MNIPDQSDLLLKLAALEAKVVSLTTERDTALGLATETEGRLTSMTSERDTAVKRAQTAEAEVARTLSELTTAKAERDSALTAKGAAESQLTDFNAKVAAEVRRLGLAKAPAATAPAADRKLTATERVLEAKGVQSISQLEAIANKAEKK